MDWDLDGLNIPSIGCSRVKVCVVLTGRYNIAIFWTGIGITAGEEVAGCENSTVGSEAASSGPCCKEQLDTFINKLKSRAMLSSMYEVDLWTKKPYNTMG